jgi:hypothetical protein
VLLASLGLSAAFDIVDIDLLIKQICILGLPNDIIDLKKVWLKNCMFYVTVNGSKSMLHGLIMGTMQGSI